ncbi:MAG: hypothetical protein PUP92_25740 [Rhizonema sp. PD38]|nr:hypothetical protein [Rhizonema sp. PD38]
MQRQIIYSSRKAAMLQFRDNTPIDGRRPHTDGMVGAQSREATAFRDTRFSRQTSREALGREYSQGKVCGTESSVPRALPQDFAICGGFGRGQSLLKSQKSKVKSQRY